MQGCDKRDALSVEKDAVIRCGMNNVRMSATGYGKRCRGARTRSGL